MIRSKVQDKYTIDQLRSVSNPHYAGAGGDIASGVIQKFHRSGFQVVVLEVGKPSFIRRTVCYGEAVYKNDVMS